MKKNFFILSILFIFTLSTNLYGEWMLFDIFKSDSDICSKCKKPINGKYIKIGNKKFHPDCFVCDKCKLPIRSSYQNIGSKYYHPECYKEIKGLRCAWCGELLGDRWQEYNNKKYHPDCYRLHVQSYCGVCGRPIEGKYYEDENGKYHESCYKNYILDKCCVCGLPLEGKYIVDPWGNKAHATHKGKKTITCDSCSIIISNETSNGGYKYSDGRHICGYCRATAVDDNGTAQLLLKKVLKSLSSKGMKNIPKNIPIDLVNRKELNKLSGSWHSSNTKGFTKTKNLLMNNIKTSSSYNIYILHGLPELEFKGTLAHELLHVWINEHDVELSHKNTEGFCNLGSALIYESEGGKFSEILLNNLDKDPDPVYGDGYRDMKEILEKYGWKGLIKNLMPN